MDKITAGQVRALPDRLGAQGLGVAVEERAVHGALVAARVLQHAGRLCRLGGHIAVPHLKPGFAVRHARKVLVPLLGDDDGVGRNIDLSQRQALGGVRGGVGAQDRRTVGHHVRGRAGIARAGVNALRLDVRIDHVVPLCVNGGGGGSRADDCAGADLPKVRRAAGPSEEQRLVIVLDIHLDAEPNLLHVGHT